MNSALLVALTSILSAVIAGGITIWSKYLDTKQKLNEHRMSIRNIFITKKIQAGELFIAKNTFAIATILLMIRYYTHLMTVDVPFDFYAELIKSVEEREKALLLEASDYTELYYEVESILIEYRVKYDLMHEKHDELANFMSRNHITNMNNEARLKLTDADINNMELELNKKLNEIIIVLNEMLALRRAVSTYMRTQLSSYDTL